MSRIDEALRHWERARGAETTELEVAHSTTSLNQYPNEAPGGHPDGASDRPSGEALDRQSEEAPKSPRVLESAPSFQPASTSRRTVADGPKLSKADDLQARLVTGAPGTVSLEQYRRLAAVLHEEQVQRQLKTVMFTSALPREGKTLTLVNLALTLGESYGRRVLAIDADLRWPSLHSFLNIPNERGLTEALRDPQDALPLVEVSSRLSALTAGNPGQAPLAGLTSARMGEVLEECAKRFDWVLIDTSPVGVLPDAQVLARFAGAVIFVIAAGSTPAATVERAIAELGGPDAIFGTVLNRVEDRQIPDAHYYGQYGTSARRR